MDTSCQATEGRKTNLRNVSHCSSWIFLLKDKTKVLKRRKVKLDTCCENRSFETM